MKGRIRKNLDAKIDVDWEEETLGVWIYDEDSGAQTRAPWMNPHRCQGCRILFWSQKARDKFCGECRYRGSWLAEKVWSQLPGQMDWRNRREQAESQLKCRYKCGWEDRRKEPQSEPEFYHMLLVWAARLVQHERRHQLRLLTNQCREATQGDACPDPTVNG